MPRLDPIPGPPAQRPPRTSLRVAHREAGQALIQRINGWLITGAVAGTGLVSVVAAHAFHGHAVSTGTHTAASSSASSGARRSATSAASRAGAATRTPASGSASGLQSPSQSPAPAAPAPAPVVSGGS